MRLDKEKAIKYVSIKEFIDTYHPGLTRQAIQYACSKDRLDYYQPNREKFIVINEKVRQYTPQSHPKRKALLNGVE